MNTYYRIKALQQQADKIMLTHFDKPIEPIRDNYRSHTEFGIAMDKYEVDKHKGIKTHKERKADVAPIYNEIEQLIRDESGLSKLPKVLADKFYRIACEQGHSSGFQEILSYAIDYKDIVEDILAFKRGEI